MIKIIIIFVLLSSCDKKNKGIINLTQENTKKKTINLTESDLMIICKNAYLNGITACTVSSDYEMTKTIWQIDSTNISEMFFK